MPGQGNPLGADGLQEASKGLAKNLTLTVINLADIGVCDEDLDAIIAFKDALSLHPTLFKVGASPARLASENSWVDNMPCPLLRAAGRFQHESHWHQRGAAAAAND